MDLLYYTTTPREPIEVFPEYGGVTPSKGEDVKLDERFFEVVAILHNYDDDRLEVRVKEKEL